MAILISKQDTNITTNQFYRVEASQLGTFGTTVEALSTARQIAVTFANAGNCQGIVIQLRTALTDIVTAFRDVTVELQENVASVWTIRATKTLTQAQIQGTSNPAGSWIVPFEFSAPYAVTTAGSTWRFNIVSAAGAATRHWDLCKTGTGATNYIYATWCDTQLTPVSGSDFIIFKNYVDITTSFTFKGQLGVADTTRAFCAWVCRNIDPTPATVAYVRIPTTIDSPVTIGIDGHFVLSSHAGIRAGGEGDLHPADNVKIQCLTPTVGTGSASGITDASNRSVNGGTSNRCSIFLYGVVPTLKGALSTSVCATGGTTINVDAPSAFAVDDFIMIGKRATSNPDDEAGTPKYRITGIAGNTLTFTPVLAGTGTVIGGKVLKTYNNATNATGYGITFRRVGGTNVHFLFTGHGVLNNYILKGVFTELVYHDGANTVGSVEDTAYSSEHHFKDVMFLNSSALNSYAAGYGSFLTGGTFPFKGMHFENCIFTRAGLMGNPAFSVVSSGNPLISYVPTRVRVTNVIIMRIGANGVITGTIDVTPTTSIQYIVDGLYVDSLGAGRTGLFLCGTSSSWKNIEIWSAASSTTYNGGAVRVNGLYNSTVENVTVNRATVAVNFETSSVGNTFKNFTFGNEIANITDFKSNIQAFAQGTFKTITGNPTFNTTDLANNATGTEIKFENVNGTNIDFVYQPYGEIFRTGTGLADTIVHTAGGFALRFQPKSSASTTYWTQNIPTGNIQNLTMTVGVWVKMNNAAYWAGSYQMPRLTVSYDNGASSNFVEAAQNTDWQFIFLAITPTTTFGQITFTVDGKTDATGSNAYFYIDDFSAPLPQGSTLNLGGLDLFSNGLPVEPSNFATTVTAADVWAADPTLFGASTVGDKVNKIKNDTALIPAAL